MEIKIGNPEYFGEFYFTHIIQIVVKIWNVSRKKSLECVAESAEEMKGKVMRPRKKEWKVSEKMENVKNLFWDCRRKPTL